MCNCDGLVSFNSIPPDLSIEGSNVKVEQWVLEIFTCLRLFAFALSFLHCIYYFCLNLSLLKPLSLLYFTLLATTPDPCPHQMLCRGPIVL